MADYLIHYNKNHHPKTGRFDFGDGDGDGIRDDHSNEKKESFGSKVTNAARRYGQLRDEYREDVLKNEQYKISKGDLRLQQDEIARQRTSAKNDARRDNLDLARMRSETRSEIRLRKMDEQRLRRELMAERDAARREQRRIKREDMLERAADRREKQAQRQISKEQREFNRLVQKQRKRAAAEERAEGKRKSRNSRLIVEGVIAGVAGMPLTSIRKFGKIR